MSMIARGHVIDRAIIASVAGGADLDTVRSRCEDLGERIGLGRDEAARAFSRWSKRSSCAAPTAFVAGRVLRGALAGCLQPPAGAVVAVAAADVVVD